MCRDQLQSSVAFLHFIFLFIIAMTEHACMKLFQSLIICLYSVIRGDLFKVQVKALH